MRRTGEQKVVTLALWPSASLAAQLNVVWVRMAERSKALRSGRSPLLWAWVRIPLLTTNLFFVLFLLQIWSKSRQISAMHISTISSKTLPVAFGQIEL